MCSEIDPSVDKSSLWLSCSINLLLLFHHDWFCPWISFSGKELEKTFARVSITLVLCILAKFPKFLDPLSMFSTFFKKILSALPVERSVFSMLKTAISPKDKLFVTFPVESVLGNQFWVDLFGNASSWKLVVTFPEAHVSVKLVVIFFAVVSLYWLALCFEWVSFTFCLWLPGVLEINLQTR